MAGIPNVMLPIFNMDSNRVTDSISIMKVIDTLSESGAFSSIEQIYYSSLYPRDNFTLDRALLKLYFDKFDLYIGRQQVAWGTGYAWNPTDIWNIKSPLDPAAARQGVNAIRAEIPLGRLGQVAGVVVPGVNIRNTSGGLRIKQNIKGFDLSLCSVKMMTHDRALFGLPKKLLVGADMAGQIPGEVGVWAEVAFTNPVPDTLNYADFDSAFLQIDAGMDYTLENGLYLMLEYYFNGSGKSSAKHYNFMSLLNLFAGEVSGLARNYLFFGLRKDFLELFNFGLYINTNLDDKSAVILPSWEYDFTDGISINLGANLFIGDKKESEYGSFFSSSILRVTGYF
ncbi:MAG: hypothetical protein ABIA63_02580 [bacterium]